MRDTNGTAKTYGEGSPGRAFAGAILGMLAALWLCQAIYAVSGRIYRLPFIAFPLFICGLTLLFRGGGRKLCLVLTIVFSAAGALLVPAGCLAVDYAVRYGSVFLSVIPVTLVMVPDSRVITGASFSSAYVLPLAFIVVGILIAWELYRYKIQAPDYESGYPEETGEEEGLKEEEADAGTDAETGPDGEKEDGDSVL